MGRPEAGAGQAGGGSSLGRRFVPVPRGVEGGAKPAQQRQGGEHLGLVEAPGDGGDRAGRGGHGLAARGTPGFGQEHQLAAAVRRMRADMDQLRTFYLDKRGVDPSRKSPVRLAGEDAPPAV